MSFPSAAVAALAALLVLLPSAPAASVQLFGTVEFRSPSLRALPQWQQTLDAIAAEQATYDACARDKARCPSRGAQAWQAMIESQSGRPRIDQILAVNRFLNEWTYKRDIANYGRRDYWATPLEFLRRSGDCEDYAIAKYVTLRRLDFSPEELRLVVVRDQVREIAHAVLAVYLDDQIYILDNLTSSILPHREVSHYVPYYSTNETGRWAHVTPIETATADRGAESPVPSAENAQVMGSTDAP